MTVGEKAQGGVPEGHPLTLWAPRFAAEQMNRFKVVGARQRRGEPEEVDKADAGVRGEDPGETGGERRGDFAAGRYPGTRNRFGSVLVMTANGVAVGTGQEKLTGPSPDKYVEHTTSTRRSLKYVDDVTGTELPVETVKAARKEEIDWLAKEEVYERVPMSICQERGFKPLQWLDVVKGDSQAVKATHW